jgi:hypothetical protein
MQTSRGEALYCLQQIRAFSLSLFSAATDNISIRYTHTGERERYFNTHTRGIKVGYTAASRALAKLGGRAAAAGAPPPHTEMAHRDASILRKLKRRRAHQ